MPAEARAPHPRCRRPAVPAVAHLPGDRPALGRESPDPPGPRGARPPLPAPLPGGQGDGEMIDPGTRCDRFEAEALLLLEQGQPLDEHFSSCSDCLEARAAYDRLR